MQADWFKQYQLYHACKKHTETRDVKTVVYQNR